nr:hypothetical protein Q903MT_gene3193 [Picea sitchensis]
MEWHGGRHYHEEPTLFAILLNPPLLTGRYAVERSRFISAGLYIHYFFIPQSMDSGAQNQEQERIWRRQHPLLRQRQGQHPSSH